MRAIKFRAWIEDEKRFIYCDDSEENYLGTFFTIIKQIEKLSGKKVTIDQFTGLKANGKEIYEGDIIRFEQNNNDDYLDHPDGLVQVSYMKYSDLEPAFWIDSIPDSWGCIMPSEYDIDVHFKKFDVIGSVYENPELLK